MLYTFYGIITIKTTSNAFGFLQMLWTNEVNFKERERGDFIGHKPIVLCTASRAAFF